MRNLVKNLAGRVFRALGGDTVELTREAYRLIVPKGFKVREADDSPEYAEWLREMAALAASPRLRELLAAMGAGQRDLIAEEAKGEEQINLARGTLNALALERQLLDGYVSELRERLKPGESFDKFGAI